MSAKSKSTIIMMYLPPSKSKHNRPTRPIPRRARIKINPIITVSISTYKCLKAPLNRLLLYPPWKSLKHSIKQDWQLSVAHRHSKMKNITLNQTNYLKIYNKQPLNATLQPSKINLPKTRPIPIAKIEKLTIKVSNSITVRNHILSLPTNNPIRPIYTIVISMRYHPISPSAKVIPLSKNRIVEVTAKIVLKIVRAIKYKSPPKTKRKALKY